jgi:hypothetical protein
MNRLSLRNNRLKLETLGELQIILEESIVEYIQMNKAKLEDVNMYPVGFRITRILTDYVQKLPGHWSGLSNTTRNNDGSTKFRLRFKWNLDSWGELG